MRLLGGSRGIWPSTDKRPLGLECLGGSLEVWRGVLAGLGCNEQGEKRLSLSHSTWWEGEPGMLLTVIPEQCHTVLRIKGTLFMKVGGSGSHGHLICLRHSGSPDCPACPTPSVVSELMQASLMTF